MPRIKADGDLASRIRRLEQLAMELGLTLTNSCQQQIVIEDSRTGMTVEYRDIEHCGSSGPYTSCFPHDTETCIFVSNEQWEKYTGWLHSEYVG